MIYCHIYLILESSKDECVKQLCLDFNLILVNKSTKIQQKILKMIFGGVSFGEKEFYNITHKYIHSDQFLL